MRILVTGPTGPTASLAVRALIGQRHTVRCLLYNNEGREFLPAAGFEAINGDLENPDSVRAALEGMEAVAHIAHIRFAPGLIAACAETPIRRVVFFSSTRRFTRFDCPIKRAVEEGERAIEASALDYTILRPSMIYGSRRDNNISRLIAYLRRHRFFPLIGGGGNLVQPVFTLDVAEALVETLRRPETTRKAYTLAGPAPMTYRQMIETIGRSLARPVRFIPVPLGLALLAARCYRALVRRPRITPDVIERLGEDRAFDIAEARRDLGFNPVAFEEGVRRQLAGELDAVWTEEPRGTN